MNETAIQPTGELQQVVDLLSKLNTDAKGRCLCLWNDGSWSMQDRRDHIILTGSVTTTIIPSIESKLPPTQGDARNALNTIDARYADCLDERRKLRRFIDAHPDAHPDK
jgi:hypothetical protein